MIEKLWVKRFKSLAEVELSLGKVNVFIGANGSGKSNLLEAIGVLSAAAAGRVDDAALLRCGVRPGLPALYACAFPSLRRSPNISFVVSGTQLSSQIPLLGDYPTVQVSYDVALFNPIANPNPAWRYHSEDLREGGAQIVGRGPASQDKGNPEAGLAALAAAQLPATSPAGQLLNVLRDYCIYAPTTPVLRGIAPDHQQRDPLGLGGGRLPEALSQVLQRRRADKRVAAICRTALSLIDWAQSYGVASPGAVPLSPAVGAGRHVIRFVDRFMKSNRNQLSGYDASEGALYVLFHAVLATHPKAPLFCAVDNADHALNPRLARELFRHLCQWYTDPRSKHQILLTTHNPLALDGLPLQNDEVRLFAVGRTDRGHTTVRRIVLDAKMNKMVDQGWSLSSLWAMGHLGGVPNV